MNKELISKEFKNIQDSICSSISELTSQTFSEDCWIYEKGIGGGRTRTLAGGIIEKGGVNFSSLSGQMSNKISKKMVGKGNSFYATGVSIVIHPDNPFVPSIHMNIRYIERDKKAWFGGGIDLTPYYINVDEVVEYHTKLKNICDKHECANYYEFKDKCDEYFYIKHRKETRGVGGIFFDYLQGNLNEIFDFVTDIGYSFNDIFHHIFRNNFKMDYDNVNKKFQQYRRGRYVEFNLVYDRGTLFGLETDGRIESILMSLPPTCNWKYDWRPSIKSKEAELYKYLKPIDWINL
tara:strand:- start:5243 stop:6118 length:876 start_codon:yes stop_codon:yes gene_type:complete